jgi:DNA-binding transcriptional ArsR family regulator
VVNFTTEETPMPDPGFIKAPEKTAVQFAVEPAINVFNSLMSIFKAEHVDGLARPITQIAAALPPERAHTHRVVMSGLYYAVEPDRGWPSFPAYLDYMGTVDPARLRDRLLARYISPLFGEEGVDTSNPPAPAALLASVDVFLDFLHSRLPTHGIDEAVESQAFALLNDPPRMQDVIVSHLRVMWEEYMAAEWKRVEPMVRESAAAWQMVDFGSMPVEDVFREMTGQEPDFCCGMMIEQVRGRVEFVPSPHIGPYFHKILGDGVLWVLFGARMPAGVRADSPELDIAEMLVRLSALSDETRLRILALVAQHGELCTPEIMAELDLPQSTAQRHLKQLSATGYLTERRREGSKCFSLNPARIDDTLEAVHALLGRA